jgi:uncharacterized protein (DUF2235 family)
MHTNIVLLSDGTGNSAASPFKTNVWRLYQALDIAPVPFDKQVPRQVVYYDNGVGTENFKPLAALGGAIGIGVWRNVRDLYTFVCRNYVAGDQIYGFGFSRGAFTIRLLMGLIGKCGIIKADSEAKLIECVQMAYEAYRRDFLLRASKQQGMIYHHIPWLLRPPRYLNDDFGQTSAIDLEFSIRCRQEFPEIRFVGVWDTVDAYGMPVDELKLAIDEWVWPMSFADRDPSWRIRTLRHALSLDDERPTFRPVLWNEELPDPFNPTKKVVLDPDRIQQVWFSGVHANVGGGYPDDGLAFVTLDWMMAEAEAQGLRFIDWIRNEVAARANPQGEQYDSRAGVAGYYRYGPRKVAELCDDKEHGVRVPTVRVHPAAFNRIVARERDYAPVSLGGAFSVSGKPMAPADSAAMEQAADIVWWRRFVYFTTLEVTAFLSLFFLKLVFEWPKYILGFTEHWLSSLFGPTATQKLSGGWNWLLDNVGSILPGWAGSAIPSFREYPLSGIVALILLALMFFGWANALQRRIRVFSEWAWAGHKGMAAAAKPSTNWLNPIARAMRPITGFLYRTVWRKAAVSILGIGLGMVAIILFSPYWIVKMFRRRPWMA